MTKSRQNKARNETLGFQREKPDRKKHANVVRMKPMGVLKTKSRQNERNRQRSDEVICTLCDPVVLSQLCFCIDLVKKNSKTRNLDIFFPKKFYSLEK